MNAELHRRVVVIKDQNAIQARPLGARLGLGDDRRARPGPVRTAVVLGHADGKERAAIADLSGRGSEGLLRHDFTFDDPRPAAARPRWRHVQYGPGPTAPQADRKSVPHSEY